MKRDPVFKITHWPINLLIQKIDSGDTALPELQRPFVWDNAKVRDLFDSLYKGLPIGVIILWKINQNASPSRPIGVSEKYTTPSELIIDGQQRLTALYSVMLGCEVLDKNYQPKKIKIAFNPFDETFEVQNSSILKDPIWVSNITDVFEGDPFDFIDEYFEMINEKIPDLPSDEKKRIRRNISSLTDLKSYNFSLIELSDSLDLEEISEIFKRINSQGATLNNSDFIFTLMSIYWPDGKNRLEEFSKDAKIPSISSNVSFNAINEQPTNENLLRTLISYSFLRGRLKYAYLLLSGRNLDEKKTTIDERNKNFDILKDGLDVVLDLVNWHDFIGIIQSSGFVNQNMIRGKNALYQTYAIYLLGRCKFNINHMELESVIRKWFVFSVLTRRYSGSPESVIESELSHFRESTDLIGVLTEIMDNELTTDYWNITLPPTLESSQPTNNNTYNVYKACKVFEGENILFSEIKLYDYLGPSVKSPKRLIEHHHIFPKNYLQKEMKLKQKDYNQVANMIYIDYHKNIEIGDMPPHEYWEYILNNKCTPNTKEFVENNYVEVYDLPKNFWNMKYSEFLEARRKLMAKSIHNYFDKL